jgi:hypothetical protein
MSLTDNLSITAYRPLNRWDYSCISPGPVGSVGDTLGQIRYKHSFPAQGLRLDSDYQNNKQNRLGSNVSDGNHTSFTSGGRGDPFTLNSPWTDLRIRKTSWGEVHQDVRAPDKLHEPRVGAVPQLEWINKLATVYNAKRTGHMFLPLPGPYIPAPGETPRGSQIPKIQNVTPPEQFSFSQTQFDNPNFTDTADAYFQQTRQLVNPMLPNVTRTRMR